MCTSAFLWYTVYYVHIISITFKMWMWNLYIRVRLCFKYYLRCGGFISKASISQIPRYVLWQLEARETYSTRLVIRINTTRYAGLQASGLARLQDSKIQDYYLSWHELPAQITVCEALELYPISRLNKLNPNICWDAVKRQRYLYFSRSASWHCWILCLHVTNDSPKQRAEGAQ